MIRYGRLAAVVLALSLLVLAVPAAAAPVLLSFGSPNSSGIWGPGDTLVVNATYDEALAPGSSIDILLNNSVPLTLDSLSAQINPRHKGSIVDGAGGANLDHPESVFVSGDYAYIAGLSSGLEVVDISDPANPIHVTNFGPGGESVFVSGNYAYVISFGDLWIMDVTNPAAPSLAGMCDVGSAKSVFVSGNYAYVASWRDYDGLRIVDVTNKSGPVEVGYVAHPSLNGAMSVFVSGDYAYVPGSLSNTLVIVNVSNPAAPAIAGSIADGAGGAKVWNPLSVYVVGDYAYVASDLSDAMEIVDVSDPANPIHAASISNEYLNGACSVFVSGDYAYVASRWSNALEIVDVSDPTNPVHAAAIVNGAGGALLNNPWSVQVSGNFAYVISKASEALEVISINSSTLSGTYTVGPGQETPLLNVSSITGQNAVSLDGTRTNTSSTLPATNLADGAAIEIVDLPIAGFTGTPTAGTAPFTVTFTDASTGSPDCWNWSFGDGTWFNTTDTALASPSYTYADAGTYTVNLTVGRAGSTDTLSRAGYVTVSPLPTTPPTTPPTATPVRGDGGPNTDTGVGFATDLKEGDSASFAMDKGAIYKVVVTAGSDISRVMVTVKKERSLPSSFNEPEADDVYEYEQVTLYYAEDSDLSGRMLYFRIPTAWLSSNGYDGCGIVLMRYNEETRVWDMLPTVCTGEAGSYHYYTAETPSFSWFAIAVVPGATIVPEETPEAPAAPIAADMAAPGETESPLPAETAVPDGSQPSSPMPAILVPAAILVLVIGTEVQNRLRKN
jgi:PGF-pre-PGF domain-containing protein